MKHTLGFAGASCEAAVRLAQRQHPPSWGWVWGGRGGRVPRRCGRRCRRCPPPSVSRSPSASPPAHQAANRQCLPNAVATCITPRCLAPSHILQIYSAKVEGCQAPAGFGIYLFSLNLYSRVSRLTGAVVQGYLAYKKRRPPKTLR